MFSNRAVLLALILAPAAVQGQMSIRTVALSGDQCPGMPAGTTIDNLITGYGYFQPGPTINNLGQVAFLNNSNCGQVVFSEGRGALAIAARAGVVPGFGALMPMTSGPRFNDDGDIVFQGFSNLNYVGIFSDRGGTLHSMMRGGMGGTQPPGAQPGSYFNYFGYGDYISHSPNMSRSGYLSFFGELSNYQVGVWGGKEENLTAYAITSMQIPGQPLGQLFEAPASFNRANTVNNSGQIFFPDITGYWLATPPQYLKLYPYPVSIPNMPAGYQLADNPRLNDAGDLLLTGRTPMADRSYGVRNGSNGSTRHVATEDVTQAPGQASGVKFSNIEYFGVAMNGRGQVALRGELSGPGITSANRDGFWAEDIQGFLKLLVQTGMQAPGFEPGVRFAEFGLSSVISINAHGYAVMGATIMQNGTPRSGYWSGNADTGELFPILMHGQSIEVRPGDVRVIANVFFGDAIGTTPFSSGSQDGLPSGLNDNNQAAFRVSFTDGSSGIFVVTIPEPTTLVLVAVASLAFVDSRARKRR